MANKEIKNEDIETLKNMFSALVDLLEKKKIIFDREFDEHIKMKNLRTFHVIGKKI